MKNLIQEGEVLLYSNTGSVISSGSPVVIGNRIGIAAEDIAATNGSGSIEMEGVYQLDKTTSQAWTMGQTLFWDTVTLKLTTVPTANTVMAGYASQDAGSADTKGNVNLETSYNQVATKAAISTADGSDASTTQALANATKTAFNDLLVKLKAAGIMIS